MTKKLVNGLLVDLTPEEQAEYDAAQAAFNSPQAVQARLLAALAAHRYAVECAGLAVNGLTVATDDRSKVLLNGAATSAMLNPLFSTEVKTLSGWVQMNAEQVKAVALAVGAYVNRCFAAEKAVFDNIANYTTAAEVIAAFDAEMAA